MLEECRGTIVAGGGKGQSREPEPMERIAGATGSAAFGLGAARAAAGVALAPDFGDRNRRTKMLRARADGTNRHGLLSA